MAETLPPFLITRNPSAAEKPRPHLSESYRDAVAEGMNTLPRLKSRGPI